MKELLIHVQPTRDIQFSSDELVNELRALNLDLQHARYDDDGLYENITLVATDIARLWGVVNELFYSGSRYSRWLREVSIVTCHGDKGWDDYLLLYHFDSNEALDRIT